MPRTHLRRAALVTASLLPTLALAACGGDEKVGAKPDLPSETPALWNPCDALDTAFVKAQFGIDATEHAGTPTKPECRFTPAEGSGDAVITSNYLLFPGTLDQAWKTMGQGADADVRTPSVEQADDARVVVNATGAWAASIGAMAGVTLPIHPLRRHIFIGAPPAGAMWPSNRVMVID